MNEIKKEYYGEIAERSITAKSSHNKNGGNSEKLGSRQLSNAEIEEKHGPVKTYTFNDFLQFSEFREMPLDWQVGYINNLEDKYDIGLTQIGRDLFDQKDENVLRSHLRLKGILDKVNPDKRRGRTKLHQFRRDIREYRVNGKKEEPIPMFLDWVSFTKLPLNAQKQFIKRLVDTYHMGIRTIDDELFGNGHKNVLAKHLKRRFDMAKDFGIRRGSNLTGPIYYEYLSKFKRDIAEWRTGEVATDEPKPAPSIIDAMSDVAKAATNAMDKLAVAMQPVADQLTVNPDPEEIEELIHEAEKQLNEKLEREGQLRVNDINQALGMKSVPEELNSVTHVKPVVFKTEQKVFHTTYIGSDFNTEELAMLRKMFAGQKIRVEITITTDSLLNKYE